MSTSIALVSRNEGGITHHCSSCSLRCIALVSFAFLLSILNIAPHFHFARRAAPPSMVPSRAHLQSITTIPQFGSSMEFDSAYGYIFNIRSTTTGPAVIITGIDFVTESTARVNYELWSRLGSYESYKGTYDGWELVASGTTRGQGSSGYTSIPDAMFTPVSIPGGSDDDGTRAFYLTLNTKELVYKLGESGAAVADKQTQATSEELEVYEGESIMSYPFPDAETQSYFYRGPRQFVGVIHYDRLPCKPFSLYGQVDALPCPIIPTISPRPTDPPSDSPVTLAPTASMPPSSAGTSRPSTSLSPSFIEPTASPVDPIKANVITNLRNTPSRDMDERESDQYIVIVTDFLQKYSVNSMVIEEIEMWHQKPTTWVQKSVRRRAQVRATEVTLIIRISSFNPEIPQSTLGDLCVMAIQENEDELLSSLRVASAAYPFFDGIDAVQSMTIEKVTSPPTASPGSAGEKLAEPAEALGSGGVVEGEPGANTKEGPGAGGKSFCR